MNELQIGNINIAVTKKSIKNMYIRVLPPDGKVLITVPQTAGDDAIRMFAVSRICLLYTSILNGHLGFHVAQVIGPEGRPLLRGGRGHAPCSVPVSYTHLDVYKRQALNRLA